MNFSNLKEKAGSLPQVPGSYIFKDKTGRVIYVGKAKNLRSRVGSYFNVAVDTSSKTAALVRMINDLEFIEVESEFEALILEAELIKKYKPKYNIVLKDDRSNLYIVIRSEKVFVCGKNISLPKVITARKTELQKKDLVYGPFPNSEVAKNILVTIRKVFTFRDCSAGKFNRYKKIGSPCLYGHIGVCSAPCIAKNELELKAYKKRILSVKKILSGQASKLILDIGREMKKSSHNEEFEKAAEYRNLLEKFSYVQRSFHDAAEYIGNPYLVEDLTKKSLEEIVRLLPFLGWNFAQKKEPKRIECFDISNISGKEAVGSMVVAVDGKITKKEYRRFRIKFKNKPDDFGMMYEVLYRRLKREVRNERKKNQATWGVPDLIIVDGGRPQVSAALEVMKDLYFDVPVVGLAKKFEHLVYFDGAEFKEVGWPKSNLGMKLLITLRDESHRFAQSYHHLLRKKSLGV